MSKLIIFGTDTLASLTLYQLQKIHDQVIEDGLIKSSIYSNKSFDNQRHKPACKGDLISRITSIAEEAGSSISLKVAIRQKFIPPHII